MDREIKFRAWDGERMIYLSDLSIGLKKGKRISPYAYFSKDTFGNQVKLGKHEIMKFTGLKDKKGQDVYEGDIMQHENPFDTPFVVNWNDKDCAFVFDNGDTGYIINDRSFTVIGNIYENPELLNNKDNGTL